MQQAASTHLDAAAYALHLVMDELSAVMILPSRPPAAVVIPLPMRPPQGKVVLAAKQRKAYAA